jgi:hypothetical protein
VVLASTDASSAHAATVHDGKRALYRCFEFKEAFIALTDEYEPRMHAELEAAVRTDHERGVDVLLTRRRSRSSATRLSRSRLRRRVSLLCPRTLAEQPSGPRSGARRRR